SAIATVIALRVWGEGGIALATLLLTMVILIFSEVTPKTLAALHPERFAFPASLILRPLLRMFYPLVWLINSIANLLLRPMGVKHHTSDSENLNTEELRTVVNEAGTLIPVQHQKMLISILDLEKVTVNDIMVPRNELVSIDLEDDWPGIQNQLTTTQHTRLLVHRGGIDNVVGLIHARNLLNLLGHNELHKEGFIKQVREPYYVPENTPLHTQLLNFRKEKRRIGLVVNEYGDLQGLVTLEDILEEIVGEFTSDPASHARDIHPQDDGSFLVDGSASIRVLNRALGIELPLDGPKTINGMILEYLETIPETGTSLMLSGYPIEIMQTGNNIIKTIRIHPEYQGKDNNE
ncbi:MAG: DUF21 domain-containing protein, partial [Gammaproteobacteria bacterium]|nr:DUF21 domain-containing protein [Gammaproteobacteria bacterium]